MFVFDKDMERVMLAKKKEVLAQIEDAKKRVLEELYCVKREVHTDFCEMLADYNRIDFTLKKLVADLKQEVKECVDSYKNILAEQIVSFNQQIDTKINMFEQYVIESIATLENALAELETMQTTVNNAIVRLNELLSNSVTHEELEQAIANIDVTKEIQDAIASTVVQSDWSESDETSNAFVKNRTHYSKLTKNNSVSFTIDSLQTVGEYAADVYPLVFIVPIDVSNPPSELSVKISNSYDGIIYEETLVGKTRDIVLEYQGIFDGYNTNLGITIHNAIVYGEWNGATSFVSGEDNPYAIFIADPVDNKLYYCQNLERRSYHLLVNETLTVTTVEQSVVKTLDAVYLGTNPSSGHILTAVGDIATWTKPVMGIYGEVSLHPLRTIHLDSKYEQSFQTYEYYNYDYEPMLELGNVYVCRVNGSEPVICQAEDYGQSYMLRIGSHIMFREFYNDNYFKLNGGATSTIVPNKQEIEGGVTIEISVYSYNEKISNVEPRFLASNPVNGSYLCVNNGVLTWMKELFAVSPNGNIYQLNVSDDGILTTSLVTP